LNSPRTVEQQTATKESLIASGDQIIEIEAGVPSSIAMRDGLDQLEVFGGVELVLGHDGLHNAHSNSLYRECAVGWRALLWHRRIGSTHSHGSWRWRVEGFGNGALRACLP
jgi:hypothetical protein